MPRGTGCKDCGSTTRPLPYPGPRCATCHRVVRRARSEAAHERHVTKTYAGMGPGDFSRLVASQGGRCAICQRATGRTRRLSVDHDHVTGETRGVLCRPCNDVLGHARDSLEFFARAMAYLVEPPARRVLTRRESTGDNEATNSPERLEAA